MHFIHFLLLLATTRAAPRMYARVSQTGLLERSGCDISDTATAVNTMPVKAANPKPVKAAPVVEAPPKKAAVAATAAPVAKVAKPVAAKPVPTEAAAKPEGEESHGRIQLATVLHINISQARCATHLKQHLGDEAAEARVKELRAALKTATDKNDATAMATIHSQIVAAAKILVRVSSETPIAVAVVWDSAVKELLRRGMDCAIAADRKIVDVNHLHEGTASAALSLCPLYNKCAAWVGYNPEHENELKRERKANTDDAVTEVAADADDSSKNSFYTYIENTLKAVKKEEAYKTMRVSNRVREYIAELVAQGIARNTTLSRIIVQQIMGVRTMTTDHVKVVVSMLMADAGRPQADIDAITGIIDEKLALYHAHLAAEREKKLRAMPAEQVAENARKQAELLVARKKKQTEMLRKRAVDSANRVKMLIAEVAQLEPSAAAK